MKVLVEHEKSISAVAISEDGKHVLTGDNDGQALLWSFKDGKSYKHFMRKIIKIVFLGAVVHKFTRHKTTIVAVEFANDSSIAITGTTFSFISIELFSCSL